MIITFDESLLTGNETIDHQHKELIERIQNFVDACEAGEGKIKAIKMLDFLEEYTVFHFHDEEELQKKTQFPGFEQHHDKHEEFRKSIAELREFLEDIEGPNEQFMDAVKKNVVEWLFGHIKTFDVALAAFVAGK